MSELLSTDSEKVLITKAKGGLGNRMLSAVTGIVLAHLNGRTPYIDWRDGMYVASGINLYPLLFDARWMGDLSSFDNDRDVVPSLWAGRLAEHPVDIIREHFPKQHQDPLLYRKLSLDFHAPDPGNRVAVFWSYLPKLRRLAGRISRSSLGSSSLDEITSTMLATYFRPVPEVESRVDALFATINAPVIGVHIRYTDRKAPLPKILNRLASLKRQNTDAVIFLATDSSEAQDAILSRFSDVRTIEKVLASGSKALHFTSGEFTDPVTEARNALVDMVALSRCTWLLHSRHSTFSVTAALMGRIPTERQADVDATNLRVLLKQFVQARI